ncbi:MAG: 3'-phosphoesterase, partial [Candidatus Aenigmarchaeota archaeon]|nr:3'-phosphoesterase [Candidatus Aenigmarchaeota archaeon]
PKEPPKEKGIKRLAIQVEDHDLSYASFEGTIPEGMYGAGTVKIWDKGKYKIIDKKPGKLVFTLNGKKMKGDYVILKLSSNRFKRGSWLFFKK